MLLWFILSSYRAASWKERGFDKASEWEGLVPLGILFHIKKLQCNKPIPDHPREFRSFCAPNCIPGKSPRSNAVKDTVSCHGIYGRACQIGHSVCEFYSR